MESVFDGDLGLRLLVMSYNALEDQALFSATSRSSWLSWGGHLDDAGTRTGRHDIVLESVHRCEQRCSEELSVILKLREKLLDFIKARRCQRPRWTTAA